MSRYGVVDSRDFHSGENSASEPWTLSSTQGADTPDVTDRLICHTALLAALGLVLQGSFELSCTLYREDITYISCCSLAPSGRSSEHNTACIFVTIYANK